MYEIRWIHGIRNGFLSVFREEKNDKMILGLAKLITIL
jgi:hypothetical protein